MTAGHPRVNCCVPGCVRGTTTVPVLTDCVWINTGTPRPEWLCSFHWPRVPRTRKRRYRALANRIGRNWPRGVTWGELGPERQALHERLSRLAIRAWGRCRDVFSEEAPAGELDPVMRDELARLGLL